MVIVGKPFNTYLWAALAMALSCGCQNVEPWHEKHLSTLGVHLEANRDTTERNELVPISREHPFMVNVQKSPFLDQGHVKQATIIDGKGGFALSLQFDRRGAWLLEQYSGANLGKHFVIFSQFAIPPEAKLNQGRWLAAPRIDKRITDGVLNFTPDATREEAEQIVLGLNNVAKQLKKGSE
jgi:preprotein translocase subunit SecD